MEAYNLPIRLREWFVKRLLKQKNDEAEEMKAAAKGGSSKGGPPTTLGAGNAPSKPVTR
jgi:hypothetical protein